MKARQCLAAVLSVLLLTTVTACNGGPASPSSEQRPPVGGGYLDSRLDNGNHQWRNGRDGAFFRGNQPDGIRFEAVAQSY